MAGSRVDQYATKDSLCGQDYLLLLDSEDLTTESYPIYKKVVSGTMLRAGLGSGLLEGGLYLRMMIQV